MKKTTKLDMIKKGKSLFTIETSLSKKSLKQYYLFLLKEKLLTKYKLCLIIIGLIGIASLIRFPFGLGLSIIPNVIETSLLLIFYLVIIFAILFIIYQSKVNKIITAVNDDNDKIEFNFYKNGLIETNRNTIFVNEYSDVKTIKKNKNDYYIIYNDGNASIVDYEALKPEEKSFLDILLRRFYNDELSKITSSIKKTKKDLLDEEALNNKIIEEEKKNKTKLLSLLFITIAFFIIIILSSAIIRPNKTNNKQDNIAINNSVKRDAQQSISIMERYNDKLENLKKINEDMYYECIDILEQDVYYDDFYPSEYYLNGESNVVNIIIANTEDITVFCDITNLNGSIAAQWVEWHESADKTYITAELTTLASENGYGYLTISNNLDDRVIQIFIDNTTNN